MKVWACKEIRLPVLIIFGPKHKVDETFAGVAGSSKGSVVAVVAGRHRPLTMDVDSGKDIFGTS